MDDRNLTTLLERTYPSAPVPPLERLGQRAVAIRRRRRTLRTASAVAAAVIVVVLGVVATLPRGDDRSVQTPLGSVPNPPAPAPTQPSTPAPTPLGAPEVQGPDPGSTLLTSYVAIHDGYAYIYADGRVIWHEDRDESGGPIPEDAISYERRLSSAGLDLVRSGALSASDFVAYPFGSPRRRLPSNVWSDPPNTPYTPWTPTKYAGCLTQEVLGTGDFRDATSRLGDLPAAAQALLHTRQSIPGAGLSLPTPSECFVLTPEERRTVLDLYYPNPFDTLQLIPATPDEGAITLLVLAILPHGAALAWGG